MAPWGAGCSAEAVATLLPDPVRWLASPLCELTVGLWVGVCAACLLGWQWSGPWGALLAAALGLLVGCGVVGMALARHFAEGSGSRPPAGDLTRPAG